MKKMLLMLAVFLMIASQVNADEVTLSWDPSTGATGYNVYMSLDMGKTWDNGVDVGNVTTVTIPDIPGTGYVYFRAGAYNGSDEAIRYTAGVWHCGDCGPPPAPAGIGVK